MLFLLLSILCSTAIALLFKRLESQGGNRYAATSANYVMAIVFGGIMAALSPVDFLAMDVTRAHFGEAIARDTALSAEGMLAWAMMVGPFAGLLYCCSFIFYSRSIAANGVGISAAVARLGVVVPLVAAVLVWGERPSIAQAVGIATAIAAILAICQPPKEGEAVPGARWFLLALFCTSGLADFSNKMFQRHADPEFRPAYLMFVFGTALLASLPFLWRYGRGASWRDAGMGALIGVPNFLASYFLLRALSLLDASIAFPVNSAGAIVAINLGGVLLFGEEFTRRKAVAVGLVLAAVVLINLPR